MVINAVIISYITNKSHEWSARVRSQATNVTAFSLSTSLEVRFLQSISFITQYGIYAATTYMTIDNTIYSIHLWIVNIKASLPFNGWFFFMHLLFLFWNSMRRLRKLTISFEHIIIFEWKAIKLLWRLFRNTW